MKLITWNTNHRLRQAPDQVCAILKREPDVVTLQEVIPSSVEILKYELRIGGLSHIVGSLDPSTSTRQGSRSLGVLIASRFPLVEDRTIALNLPWREKSLSRIVNFPNEPVEVHCVHVPPGSSNGWLKVDVLEGIYAGMARISNRPRFLCGDFNSPQREFPSGEVVTWAQRLDSSGRVHLRKRFRGGSGLRWDAAERNILSGLHVFGMKDVFRGLHGYKTEASSWILRRKGVAFGRRFDHVFASEDLQVNSCEYIDIWREAGLSDHSGLEIDFSLRSPVH